MKNLLQTLRLTRLCFHGEFLSASNGIVVSLQRSLYIMFIITISTFFSDWTNALIRYKKGSSLAGVVAVIFLNGTYNFVCTMHIAMTCGLACNFPIRQKTARDVYDGLQLSSVKNACASYSSNGQTERHTYC